MLARKNRVDTPTFKKVLSEGKNHHSKSFSLKFITSGTPLRFSAVVPKSVEKKAVGRNTLRRKIRTVLEGVVRKHPQKVLTGVVFAKKGAKDLSFKEIEKEISELVVGVR